MRVVATALLGLSSLALFAPVPALAEPAVAYVEAPRSASDPVRAAIETRLIELKSSLRSSPDRVWLEALAPLYAARDNRPIWISASGDAAKARAAAAEIARAGDWGLDASQYRLPDLTSVTRSAAAAADAEIQMSLAALTYVAHARGHRVDPSQLSKWLDQRPRQVDAYEIGFIADADDPAAALRRQHPRHPQFELLRQAYLKLRGGADERSLGVKPVQLPASGPRLKIGSEHADVIALRRRLGVEAADPEEADTFDQTLAAAVRDFQRKSGLKPTGIVTDAVRQALNAPGDGGAAKKGSQLELKKILVNMERWRWLPDDLGSTYVWNNLPEFETRVIKHGRLIHNERIIIGKTDTQTPVFSDRMQFVVFQPDWGIPNSIKITDLLPRLRGGDSSVIERRDMRVVMNGKTVPSSRIDWSRTDIREVAIYQNPGASNPLGQVKFMFPNKHDVYMHDTPAKHLFNSSVRTFSHGCIRVRNPRGFAELVFAEDRGWSPAKVGELLAAKGQGNNKVDLSQPINVHNAYFTVVANEDGTLRSLTDVYGHDRRIAMALDGTPAQVIARDDPAVRLEQSIKARRMEVASRSVERPVQQQAQRPPRNPWAGGFFGLGYN